MVRPSIKDKRKRARGMVKVKAFRIVVVLRWCESEGHHHVKESWAFYKTRA